MSPDLLFNELQRQRLHAAHISAAPRQTFTAAQKIVVFHRTPAHRMAYSERQPAKAQHGTQACYAQCVCRCRLCTSANAAYRRMRRSRPEAQHATPAEHGTTRKYRRGCKCRPCVLANLEYGRAWRAAHPPNEAA